MVTIRLTRRGGKKTPFYHVVVTDSRKRQGGTSLESVGLFNPVARGAEVKLRLDVARIEHWVSKGAHMSDHLVPQTSRLKLPRAQGSDER
jgi:small subunit ribosomal protein S16